MKTLLQKVHAVENLYKHLDKEISDFQKSTGLHCVTGCGMCCKKPDIEATPLEFLPLAMQLFDEGRAEKVLEEIRDKDDTICIAFRPGTTPFGGSCGEYTYRGMICRLFGYAARRNKEGVKELTTCKIIKEGQAKNYHEADMAVRAGAKIPYYSDYYSRLANIDPDLMDFYPINIAIKKAIETVLHYYSYRKRKKRKPREVAVHPH